METLENEPDTVVRLYDDKAGSWKFVRKDKGLLKSLEVVENALHGLGLSKNEVKVYVYLARSGMRKASEVSDAISLHRTETYRILRDLEKIGLVSSVFEKPLKFVATPFEKTIDALITAKKLRLQLLERKKKDLVDVWFSLPKPEVEFEKKEVFQILEGEEQIILKADEILDKTKKEIYVFAADSDLFRLYHSGFIDKLERLSKKNMSVRFLTNNSPKSCFFVEKMKLDGVKYPPVNMDGMPGFVISDEEQTLLLIKGANDDRAQDDERRDRTSALWTNYDAFIRVLRTLFLELWNADVPSDVNQTPLK